MKKRIQRIKKKRSGYGEILDFYQKIRKEQEKIKTTLKVEPIRLKKEWKDLLAKEGFSILERKDFPLDIEASLTLFQSLCQIAKDANPLLAEQVKKIKEALDNKKIDLKDLFKDKIRDQKLEQMSNQLGLDQKAFLFFIQESMRPSIEAGVEQLRPEVNAETWLKGYCPICGSLPSLSLLKEEEGKRYLLCSYCGYQWRTDRLICPFCNNKEQESLHYFYGEGEEAHRIDLCEKCHQYIKTIDIRRIEDSDPLLEDLATLHLDILASKKRYKKPVPNPWTV